MTWTLHGKVWQSGCFQISHGVQGFSVWYFGHGIAKRLSPHTVESLEQAKRLAETVLHGSPET